MIRKLIEWVTGNLSLVLGGIALLAAVASLSYCQGRSDGRLAADNARLQANVEAQARDAVAASQAADERLDDTIEVRNLEEELRDAIEDIPDSVPDLTAIALGCERLRRAGTDTTTIPACSRPEGRGQASPDR